MDPQPVDAFIHWFVASLDLHGTAEWIEVKREGDFMTIEYVWSVDPRTLRYSWGSFGHRSTMRAVLKRLYKKLMLRSLVVGSSVL